MRRMLRGWLAIGVLAAGAGLAGCTAGGDAPPTMVGAATVAQTAEDILEEEVGRRPVVDCGTEVFLLQNGETRVCILTDPETGLEYEASVELNDVRGGDFRVDVEVAAEAIGGGEPEPTTAALVLTGAEIGATATSALEGQVAGAYEVFCDEGDYEVTVGYQLTCTYVDDTGDYPAYIEITAIDGSNYELSISVP